MFIDSRSFNEDQTIDTDVCIVGGGVAGLTLAREFKQARFKTCVIESGGEKGDKATQALYWGENIGIPYYPLDTARARFLGGSSHYWVINLPEKGLGVRLRPLDPIDFEERTWVPYSGWPFNKTHLEPYYRRAQELCQIGPYEYDPQQWIQDDSRKALPLNGQQVQTTLFQFGRREVFFKQYAEEVKKSANVTTLLHGNVVDIQTNETATHVTRVKVACLKGNSFWVTAKIFILAVGGLEVPRLLLASTKTQNCGLGNGHDRVGRFFMEHPHLWCGAFFPSTVQIANSTGLYEVHRKQGTPVMAKLALHESTLRKEKLLNWVTSIHPDHELSYQHHVGYFKPGVAACRSLKRALIHGSKGSDLKSNVFDAVRDRGSVLRYIYRNISSEFGKGFDPSKNITVYRLNPMVEQAPNPRSRVLLGQEKDALDLPRISLDWQLTELDTYTITRAQEILDEELRNAGLGHLRIETKRDEIPKGIHGGWHHMGTTRMHADPKQGVVDPNCRVHGIGNLYIGGASVFPTSGYANPVLTTLAVVLRLADHIRGTMEA